MIIAILIQGSMNQAEDLDMISAYRLLCSGLVVGLGCLSSGYGMSRFLELYMSNANDSTSASGASNSASVETSTESTALLGGVIQSDFTTNPLPVTWSLLLSMVFLEAIGLYSLIVALFLTT